MGKNPPPTPLERITNKIKLHKGDTYVYIPLITGRVRVVAFHCMYRLEIFLYSQTSEYYQAHKETQNQWFDCKTIPIHLPLDNLPNKVNE